MCEKEITKSKRCGKYSFRLIGKPKSYFKETTLVDFAPISKTKKIQKKTILPTYNHDKKYFTPAFIIPSLPLQEDSILIEQHQKRVKQNSTQISQILLPKPRSRQKYCGVCRQYYEEYLVHIMGQKHKQKLKNSVFEKYIQQMSQMFKEQNQQKQPDFQKHNSFDTSCQTIWSSNTEDLIQACLSLQ